VQVRVPRRPLRSFLVRPNADFAMFSKAGDRAVARFVNGLIEGLASGAIATKRELVRRFDAGFLALDRKYEEAADTAVRDEIYDALYIPLRLSGYDPEEVLEF
jgi:hypothetical protein